MFACSSVLFVIAIILPIASWFGGQAWLAQIHGADPTPNQGAMLLAFVWLLASCAAAIVLLALSIGLLLKIYDNE